MQFKYLYAYNGIKSWLGGLGFNSYKSKIVDLSKTQYQYTGKPLKKYIWRNKGDDQYKITEAF